MKGCASAVAFGPLLARGANSRTSSESLGQMAGGGNFINNDTPAGQYDVLAALGARIARMAVYPAWYVEGGNPGNNDNAVIYALKRGTTILYNCEYYAWFPTPGRSYDTWRVIGQKVATRYSPGSSVLVSGGVPSRKGVMHWSAINEPDANGAIIQDYRNMIKGYADGIHSINPNARVYPGGFLSANRDAEYTGHGYIPAIVDLINNGTFAGIDLHTYADKLYAPIENTWQRSAQYNFDAVVSATGIARNIDFLITEHNFKNTNSGQGYDEAYVKRMMLPHIFDVFGCVHRDNTPAIRMALAWNLFQQSGQQNFLTTGGTNWYQGGVVYKMVIDLLGECFFVFNDPRVTGRYELTNASGSKYAWVFQNHHQTWSTDYGPWRRIDVPFRDSLLTRYNHNGRQEVIRSNRRSWQRVTTPSGETSIWIGQRR